MSDPVTSFQCGRCLNYHGGSHGCPADAKLIDHLYSVLKRIAETDYRGNRCSCASIAESCLNLHPREGEHG